MPELLPLIIKFLGITLTAILGVMGTLWETRRKRVDGETTQLTAVGWLTISFIAVAASIGAIGQSLEDRDRDAASAQIDKRQLETLKTTSDILSMATRAATPVGDMIIRGSLDIPLDSPNVRPLAAKFFAAARRRLSYSEYDRLIRSSFEPVLKNVMLSLRIEDSFPET